MKRHFRGYRAVLIVVALLSGRREAKSQLLFNEMLRTELDYAEAKKPTRVIAFSLYGHDKRYTEGAIENALLIKQIYSAEWNMRVYHDSTVPYSILHSLARLDVHLVDMSHSRLNNKMAWKFLAAADQEVERFLSRDIDSLLSIREAAAVEEWIASGRKFHVMRDHPSHCALPVSGGMWGAIGGVLPDIQMLVERVGLADKYGSDMDFLRDVIWPRMQKSLLVHDSISCSFPSSMCTGEASVQCGHSYTYDSTHVSQDEDDLSHRGSENVVFCMPCCDKGDLTIMSNIVTAPFPSPRSGHEHVGAVVIGGFFPGSDVESLIAFAFASPPSPTAAASHPVPTAALVNNSFPDTAITALHTEIEPSFDMSWTTAVAAAAAPAIAASAATGSVDDTLPLPKGGPSAGHVSTASPSPTGTVLSAAAETPRTPWPEARGRWKEWFFATYAGAALVATALNFGSDLLPPAVLQHLSVVGMTNGPGNDTPPRVSSLLASRAAPAAESMAASAAESSAESHDSVMCAAAGICGGSGKCRGGDVGTEQRRVLDGALPTYVMNLPHRTDRRRSTRRLLAGLEHFKPVYFVSADLTLAESVDLDRLIEEGLLDPVAQARLVAAYGAVEFNVANALDHVRILKRGLASGAARFAVFEDDLMPAAWVGQGRGLGLATEATGSQCRGRGSAETAFAEHGTASDEADQAETKLEGRGGSNVESSRSEGLRDGGDEDDEKGRCGGAALEGLQAPLHATREQIEAALRALPPTADMLYLEYCGETCQTVGYPPRIDEIAVPAPARAEAGGVGAESAGSAGGPGERKEGAGGWMPAVPSSSRTRQAMTPLVRAFRPVCSAGIVFTAKGAARAAELLLPVFDAVDVMYAELIARGALEAYLAAPAPLQQDAVWGSNTGRGGAARSGAGAGYGRLHRALHPICSEAVEVFRWMVREQTAIVLPAPPGALAVFAYLPGGFQIGFGPEASMAAPVEVTVYSRAADWDALYRWAHLVPSLAGIFAAKSGWMEDASEDFSSAGSAGQMHSPLLAAERSFVIEIARWDLIDDGKNGSIAAPPPSGILLTFTPVSECFTAAAAMASAAWKHQTRGADSTRQAAGHPSQRPQPIDVPVESPPEASGRWCEVELTIEDTVADSLGTDSDGVGPTRGWRRLFYLA